MMRAKWILLFTLIALTLAACAPEGPDLGLEVAGAQATLSAAEAQRRSTEKAANRERAQATQAAAATQGAAQVEIDLLAARAQATDAALDIEIERARVTEAAQMLQATQTMAAGFGRQTEAALVVQATSSALGVQATRTAIALDAQAETNQAQREEAGDNFWFWFPLILIGLVILALTGLGLWLLYRYAPIFLDWIIEWRDRPNRFMETSSGSVVWMYGDGGQLQPFLIAQLPERGATLRLGSGGTNVRQVTALTRSGSVLSAPMEPGITKLTRDLVQAAVQQAGRGSDTIPGWRHLNVSSQIWQRVMAALVVQGAVEVERGVGTFVQPPYNNLGGLLFGLETGQLKVRPTTPLQDDDDDDA